MMFFIRLPHPILCQACQAGNLEAVKIILEAGADPNHFDKTPLFYAVDENSIDSVQYLLDNHVNPNVSCTDGIYFLNFHRTPLHEAAERGSVEIVDALVEAGADVSKHNWSYITPLHLAASYGRFDVVQALVGHGAPLDARDSKGNTPLHDASRNNQSEIVSYLISKKANHLILNNEGYKAFEIAPEPLKSELKEYVIDNLMETSKSRSLRLSQVLKSVNLNEDENENTNNEINYENTEEDDVLLTPGKCIFCQASVPVYVFKPCNHVLLCDQCYINHKGLLENCPICDAFLERVESLEQPQEPEPIVEDPPEEEEKKEDPQIIEEEEEAGENDGEEEAGEISTEGESYATESNIES